MIDVKRVMNNISGKVNAIAFIDEDSSDVVKVYVRVKDDIVPLIDYYSKLVTEKKLVAWFMSWFYDAGDKFCMYSVYSSKYCAKLISYILYSPLMLEVTGEGCYLPRCARLWIPDIALFYWDKKVEVYRRKYGVAEYILYEVPIQLEAILNYKNSIKELVLKQFGDLVEKSLSEGKKSSATYYRQVMNVINNYDFNNVFKKSPVLNFETVLKGSNY